MKYFNIGSSLGVVGAEVGHTDGDYTFLFRQYDGYSWIYTRDLYDTPEEAEKAKPARFI